MSRRRLLDVIFMKMSTVTTVEKGKDAKDCSHLVSKSALENQAVIHVDLSAAISGNGDGTSLTMENLDKELVVNNKQVCNHINYPTNTREPLADHEGCAAVGKAKDMGRP